MLDSSISILVPYKPDGGIRDKNWAWIKKRYEALLPNVEICIGHSDIEPFSRAASINDASKFATGDIFIIADADIVYDIKQIEIAILGLSLYPWIVPYMVINKLTAKQTDGLLQKEPSITMSDINFGDCEKLIGQNDSRIIVGGIIIVPRKHFEKIGGFDERFKGWGREDDAFAKSMATIFGPHGRLKTTMWHLYHPSASLSHYPKNDEVFNKFYGSKDVILNNLNEDIKIEDI